MNIRVSRVKDRLDKIQTHLIGITVNQGAEAIGYKGNTSDHHSLYKSTFISPRFVSWFVVVLERLTKGPRLME